MVGIRRVQEQPEEDTKVWEGARWLWDRWWLGRVNTDAQHWRLRFQLQLALVYWRLLDKWCSGSCLMTG